MCFQSSFFLDQVQNYMQSDGRNTTLCRNPKFWTGWNDYIGFYTFFIGNRINILMYGENYMNKYLVEQNWRCLQRNLNTLVSIVTFLLSDWTPKVLVKYMATYTVMGPLKCIQWGTVKCEGDNWKWVKSWQGIPSNYNTECHLWMKECKVR